LARPRQPPQAGRAARRSGSRNAPAPCASPDGMEVSEAKRLRMLEEENAKLKRLLANTMLDNAALKDLLAKNW